MNENEVKYWNNYYAKKVAPKAPSEFARFVFGRTSPNASILDLGCGNGRDSIYFAVNGLKVTSVDQAIDGIKILEDASKTSNLSIKAFNEDFVGGNAITCNKYDNVYSRFTIHSISKEQENALVKNVYNSLNKNGKFFIEVRSIKDEIFGLGEEVCRNTYLYQGHLRRFIILDELIENLKSVGFHIEYAKESDGFAVYNGEDPICIRVVAQKK